MEKLKEIDFHITDVCNGHCPMCYATEEGIERKNGDIELLKKVVHNAIVNGEVERFVMVGGDPCEHPQLVELLRYIKDEGKANNVKTTTIVLSNTHDYKEDGKTVSMEEVAKYVDEMDETTSVPKCLQIPGGGTSDEDIKGDILDINLNLKRELKEELNLDLDKIDYEIKYLECPTKGRSVYGFLAYGKVNMTKNELNNYFEDYKKYLEENDLEIEFSKLVFLNKEAGLSELDKLKNPKREYLRELIEICSKMKD